MANGWTPERRARQAEMIRKWKPWEKSTGPRTDEGKAVVARNYQKSRRHRLHQMLPILQAAALAGNAEVLLDLLEYVSGADTP